MIDDFSDDGILKKAIKGFRVRQSQQIMAEAVTKAIIEQEQLIVEAGTGTGKTFAYLVPALRSEKKVIISTGSKALQDQLFDKDIPTVKNIIGFTGNVALLKGRANYLCLERSMQHQLLASDYTELIQKELILLRKWQTVTVDGDISKCDEVTEESNVWPLVTSTNDNCLGAECPDYDNCYVVKARKRAMNADIVVVNHHLFFADTVVKESGFGELIPQSDVVIFDEAHQLPDLASQYFGQQLSSRQFIDVAKDIILIYRTEVKDTPQLQKCADQLIKMTQDFRLNLGEVAFKGNLRSILAENGIKQSLQRLIDALQFNEEVLKLNLGRVPSLDSCFQRMTLYRQALMRIIDTTVIGFSYWFECTTYYFILGLTPLSIADKFNELVEERRGSWIFTSATLSVNENFSYFTSRLGLNKANQLLLLSPFDYQQQALLCLPRYLPPSNSEDTAKRLADLLSPLIEANQGRCFFLCTSYQMMNTLTVCFREKLSLPVLMQGETNKTNLLAQFLTQGNALLIATSSFWEGIDVRGDALSCVIIDKLPFTSPDDPLLKARIEDCQLQGYDPFLEIQLPEAVITLKQGVGRLIRDHHDRGVVVICDNRLVMRSYGSIFLSSLPPLARTRDIEKAIHFLTVPKEDEK